MINVFWRLIMKIKNHILEQNNPSKITIEKVNIEVLDKNDKYVSNETEILIEKPIREVYRWVVYEPLEKQLNGTKRIPGVASTKTINNIELGEKGHRRLVCLADGNTAVEEHSYIEKHDNNESQRYFSYKVWDYTLKVAQNIEYAIGEWWFTPAGNKTHIKWRYSFKLNDKKILGRIGFLGRVLFNKIFLKTSYNDFMIETLNKLKCDLEK
jgi:hypothetical protein